MKKKKRINDFTDFTKDFSDKWGNKEYPREIDLPNYQDSEAIRDENLEEMEQEQKEREENDEMKTESNNIREFDEHTDDDIKLLFLDYIDNDPNSFTIKNVLIHDNRVVDETPYMKDVSKYRKAKVVELYLGKLDGIHLKGTGICLKSFDKLNSIIKEIEKFYDMSDEDEINFNIEMDYMGLKLTFVIMGGYSKEEESVTDKIDDYLSRIKDLIKSKGHKRNTIKGNWLDMRFPKRGDYDIGVARKLRMIGQGEVTLHNATNDIDKEIIKVRNDAWENGLKFSLSGGDQQVVLKFDKK